MTALATPGAPLGGRRRRLPTDDPVEEALMSPELFLALDFISFVVLSGVVLAVFRRLPT